MTKKILRLLIIGIMPLYLFVSYLYFSPKSSGEICKNVVITIMDSAASPFLKETEIENVLIRNKFKLRNQEMSSINTYEIKKVLEENKIVKQAVCYKTPDATLRIDVYQRKPILRVMGINGNYYIDEEGEIMPVSYNFTAHLPIASGYVSKETAQTDLYNFALFLMGDSFWNAQIEQIYINSDKSVELIPKVGNHTIFLGDFYNFEKKLENLMTFYENGLSKRGWNIYKTINLKYDNQVIGSK